MDDLATIAAGPLYSSLGGDPDLAELVEMFIGEMPDRVKRMQDCLDHGDSEGLGSAAHQLRGAAGSYGFPQLTPVLERLESLARDEGAIDETWHAVEAVAEICSRLQPGVPE